MFFDKDYLTKLSDLNISPLMYRRYVDDVNMLMVALKHGTVFSRVGGLGEVGVSELPEGDCHSDRRTARVCREIANTVMPDRPFIMARSAFPTSMTKKCFWRRETGGSGTAVQACIGM